MEPFDTKLEKIKRFDLSFMDKTIKKEYDTISSQNLKKINIFISIFSFLFSIAITIWSMLLINNFNESVSEYEIGVIRLPEKYFKLLDKYENISADSLDSINISRAEKNTILTQLNCLMLLRVFYQKFIFVNLTIFDFIETRSNSETYVYDSELIYKLNSSNNVDDNNFDYTTTNNYINDGNFYFNYTKLLALQVSNRNIVNLRENNDFYAIKNIENSTRFLNFKFLLNNQDKSNIILNSNKNYANNNFSKSYDDNIKSNYKNTKLISGILNLRNIQENNDIYNKNLLNKNEQNIAKKLKSWRKVYENSSEYTLDKDSIETISNKRYSYLDIDSSVSLEKILFYLKIVQHLKFLDNDPCCIGIISKYDNLDLGVLIRKILFLRELLILTIITISLYLIFLLGSYFSKSSNIGTIKIIYGLNFIFYGYNFHFISGILISFFQVSTQSLFILIAWKLLIEIILVLKSRIEWYYFLFCIITNVSLEYIFLYLIHFKFNSIITYYFIVNIIVELASLIISYFNEFNLKNEFYLTMQNKNGKEYLYNLLYNISQGFVSYKDNRLVFLNKSMKKMLEDIRLMTKNDETLLIKNIPDKKTSLIVQEDYNRERKLKKSVEKQIPFYIQACRNEAYSAEDVNPNVEKNFNLNAVNENRDKNKSLINCDISSDFLNFNSNYAIMHHMNLETAKNLPQLKNSNLGNEINFNGGNFIDCVNENYNSSLLNKLNNDKNERNQIEKSEIKENQLYREALEKMLGSLKDINEALPEALRKNLRNRFDKNEELTLNKLIQYIKEHDIFKNNNFIYFGKIVLESKVPNDIEEELNLYKEIKPKNEKRNLERFKEVNKECTCNKNKADKVSLTNQRNIKNNINDNNTNVPKNRNNFGEIYDLHNGNEDFKFKEINNHLLHENPTMFKNSIIASKNLLGLHLSNDKLTSIKRKSNKLNKVHQNNLYFNLENKSRKNSETKDFVHYNHNENHNYNKNDSSIDNSKYNFLDKSAINGKTGIDNNLSLSHASSSSIESSGNNQNMKLKMGKNKKFKREKVDFRDTMVNQQKISQENNFQLDNFNKGLNALEIKHESPVIKNHNFHPSFITQTQNENNYKNNKIENSNEKKINHISNERGNILSKINSDFESPLNSSSIMSDNDSNKTKCSILNSVDSLNCSNAIKLNKQIFLTHHKKEYELFIRLVNCSQEDRFEENIISNIGNSNGSINNLSSPPSISFKKKNIDSKHFCLEFLLDDISFVMEKERRKVIENCRHVFLSKTAHEFKNPITSAIELIDLMENEEEIINEEITKGNDCNKSYTFNNILNPNSHNTLNNQNNNSNLTQFQQIFHNPNVNNTGNQVNKPSNSISQYFPTLRYLKNICRIMNNFLRDFVFFSELKNNCKTCENLVLCLTCHLNFLCKDCNECSNCKINSMEKCDVLYIIKDYVNLFESILNYENKNNIKFEINNKEEQAKQSDFAAEVSGNCSRLNHKYYSNNNLIKINSNKNALDNIYNGNAINRNNSNNFISNHNFVNNKNSEYNKTPFFGSSNHNMDKPHRQYTNSSNFMIKNPMKKLSTLNSLNICMFSGNCSQNNNLNNVNNIKKDSLKSKHLPYSEAKKERFSNSILNNFNKMGNQNNCNLNKVNRCRKRYNSSFNIFTFNEYKSLNDTKNSNMGGHKYSTSLDYNLGFMDQDDFSKNKNLLNLKKFLISAKEKKGDDYNVLTNKDLIKSMMYNLLYHCYKNTQNGKIKIDIGYLNVHKNLIQIDISTSTICGSFSDDEIKHIKDNLNNVENIIDSGDKENGLFENFNKYFQLYIAILIADKLKFPLNIRNQQNQIFYSITLNKGSMEKLENNISFSQTSSPIKSNKETSIVDEINSDGELKSLNKNENAINANITNLNTKNILEDLNKCKQMNTICIKSNHNLGFRVNRLTSLIGHNSSNLNSKGDSNNNIDNPKYNYKEMSNTKFNISDCRNNNRQFDIAYVIGKFPNNRNNMNSDEYEDKSRNNEYTILKNNKEISLNPSNQNSPNWANDDISNSFDMKDNYSKNYMTYKESSVNLKIKEAKTINNVKLKIGLSKVNSEENLQKSNFKKRSSHNLLSSSLFKKSEKKKNMIRSLSKSIDIAEEKQYGIADFGQGLGLLNNKNNYMTHELIINQKYRTKNNNSNNITINNANKDNHQLKNSLLDFTDSSQFKSSNLSNSYFNKSNIKLISFDSNNINNSNIKNDVSNSFNEDDKVNARNEIRNQTFNFNIMNNSKLNTIKDLHTPRMKNNNEDTIHQKFLDKDIPGIGMNQIIKYNLPILNDNNEKTNDSNNYDNLMNKNIISSPDSNANSVKIENNNMNSNVDYYTNKVVEIRQNNNNSPVILTESYNIYNNNALSLNNDKQYQSTMRISNDNNYMSVNYESFKQSFMNSNNRGRNMLDLKTINETLRENNFPKCNINISNDYHINNINKNNSSILDKTRIVPCGHNMNILRSIKNKLLENVMNVSFLLNESAEVDKSFHSTINPTSGNQFNFNLNSFITSKDISTRKVSENNIDNYFNRNNCNSNNHLNSYFNINSINNKNPLINKNANITNNDVRKKKLMNSRSLNNVDTLNFKSILNGSGNNLMNNNSTQNNNSIQDNSIITRELNEMSFNFNNITRDLSTFGLKVNNKDISSPVQNLKQLILEANVNSGQFNIPINGRVNNNFNKSDLYQDYPSNIYSNSNTTNINAFNPNNFISNNEKEYIILDKKNTDSSVDQRACRSDDNLNLNLMTNKQALGIYNNSNQNEDVNTNNINYASNNINSNSNHNNMINPNMSICVNNNLISPSNKANSTSNNNSNQKITNFSNSNTQQNINNIHNLNTLNNLNINYNNFNNIDINSLNTINNDLNYLTNNLNLLGNFMNLASTGAKNKTESKRILLIDDEFLVRSTLKRYLLKMNKLEEEIEYIVAEAENCFEAFNIIYRSFMENVNFDYVFIDELMPIMRGSHLISIFKKLMKDKNFYNFKFISYTSFDTTESKKLIYDHGADYIINKPISFDKFKDFVQKLNNEYNTNI